MSSAKRQCIDFVELKLEEFETTHKLPADSLHPNVWDFMQCRYPIESSFLRARLLRWWATVYAVNYSKPDLLTIYNLTPPHKRQDFFKIWVVSGAGTQLDAAMWGCELAILDLLKPGDNMAIFFRYWRAPGTPVIEKKRYDINKIAQRLGIENYHCYADDISRAANENRKFTDAPAFQHFLFKRQTAAFREWICCYFMVTLECDTPIIEPLMLHIN